MTTFADLADNTDPSKGAALVGYKGRTQAEHNADTINIRDWGAKGDGVSTDRLAIMGAVNEALTTGKTVYWPAGTYVSSNIIPDFHSVWHIGEGAFLKRGNDSWAITPRRGHVNTLYVRASGDAINDGMAPSQAVTMERAFEILESQAEKASDGIWRIRVVANISFTGVRFQNWPLYTNPVEIIGDDVEDGSPPTSTWDGTTSGEVYAFRCDQRSLELNLAFKNLRIQNFSAGSQSGGILMWNRGRYSVDNCEFVNCPIGASFRQAYALVINSLFDGCSSYALAGVYQTTMNVGNLGQNGNTFRNSAIGVRISRTSIGYVQSNTFENNGTSIECSRVSRYRPQDNTHVSWTSSAYWLDLNGVMSTDNGAGHEDTFVMVPTKAAPILRITRFGVNHAIHNRNAVFVQQASDGNTVPIVNQNGNTVLISDGRPTYVPFRLPGYALGTRSWKLEAEIYAQIFANAEGAFSIAGDTNTPLASITIAPAATARQGKFEFDIQAIDALGSYTCRWTIRSNDLGLFATGTALYDGSAYMSDSEVLIPWRLYWAPTADAQVTFYSMRSYVEI